MFISQKYPLFSNHSKKDKSVICHHSIAINAIKKVYLGLWAISFGMGMLTISTTAQASYAATIQNPNDGYLIKISSNSNIASTPIIGGDGNKYYRVGEPVVIDKSSTSVSLTGSVNCQGMTWGNDTNYLPPENTYQRFFIYIPATGFSLEGQPTYRINGNLVMTVNSSILNWKNLYTDNTTCSTVFTGIQPMNGFSSHFPITLTYYINDRIIDGTISIPAMPLGGYVRAFTNPKQPPTQNIWPIEKSTAPTRLSASTLNIAASCNTTTSTGQASTVNLRHGQLNNLNYDSLVKEKITYNCKFSIPTKVKLRIDYTKDDDPQKRLPMVSKKDSRDKIYSELKMIDEVSNQSGTELKIDIKDVRDITISSHIQGKNAVAGDYQGSAWLIATFD